MALYESNIVVELREILLKDRPKELYDISSKGTVPVLQLDQSKVIDESLDIMLWALKRNNSAWINQRLNEQLALIEINDTDFKYWLDRYKYHDRYLEFSLEYYQEQCEKYLIQYEKKLKKISYLLDNHMRLVDVALFPFIRQYANINKEYFSQTFSNLNTWLHNFISSDLFNSVMIKYKIWDKKNKIITNFRN